MTMFIYVKLIFDASVEESTVLIADNTQWVGKNITHSGTFRFETVEPEPLDVLREKYAGSATAVILYIEGEKGGYPVNFSMYSTKNISIDLQEYVRESVKSIIENRKLEEYNITNPDKILSSVRAGVDMRTVKWDKDREDKETDTSMIMMISYLLAFSLYLFIFMFGAMVMRGVIEEKSSRIIEIIISSVRPFQLMTGKILGIALVAVLQFLIWIILTVIFFGVFRNFAPESGDIAGGLTVTLNDINTVEILVFFLLFFLGGYLLYASMFAAIGSAVDVESDSQQLTAPVTVPLVIAIMIMIHTFRYPDSSLSFWASMIPFTSPVIMVARIPFGVPLWQILLSLTVLIASFAAMLHISAKIYGTGILMYGKKPSFKEIIKWLKYK
jgi:ABC-2 type transport system permease protein